MLGRLGFKLGLLGIALALPVLAADRPGSSSISGYVRSAAGVPQMGAMVEVLGTAAHNFRVFTDENGFYSASGLLPGVYSVKAYSTIVSSRAARAGRTAARQQRDGQSQAQRAVRSHPNARHARPGRR